MSDDRIKVCRKAFGDEFVAYVLNSAPALLDSVEITPERSECLGVLNAAAERVVAANSDFERDFIRHTIVGHPAGQDNESIVTALRRHCGGDLPTIGTEEPLIKALLECVRDAYPHLLLPLPNEDVPTRFPDASTSILQLDAGWRLQAEILKDEDLKLFFPEAPPPLDSISDETQLYLFRVQSDLTWISGEGGTRGLGMLAGALVGYGLALAGIQDKINHAAGAKYALEGLAHARALARKESVQLPLLVGLSNIELTAGLEKVELDQGTIHAPTQTALAHLSHLTGRAGRARLSAVLVSEAEQRLLDARPWPPTDAEADAAVDARWNSFEPELQRARKSVSTTIDRARYSLLLASGEEGRIAPAVEVVTRLSPVSTVSAMEIFDHSQLRPSKSVAIDADMASRISSWSERVSQRHPESLDIGMRRLLSAATVRTDPLDGFIDAVMCWENLFGSTPETTFKVCGAMSVLLAPDSNGREQLFKKLTTLYRRRSELVHGSREPSATEAISLRDEALDISLDAMRAAYHLPGLLDLQKSDERCKRVLLGFPQSGADG